MIVAKEQEKQVPKKVEYNTTIALSLAFQIFDKQGYVKTNAYVGQEQQNKPNKTVLLSPVSYTHLTLPTTHCV